MSNMTSVVSQKNMEMSKDINPQTLKIIVENIEIKNKVSVVIDIIIVLDESGSMIYMGNEPIQSANAFIQEQQKIADDGSTITLVTFNDESNRLIDEQLLSDVKELSEDSYHPTGPTALNDAVCTTIDNKLKSKKSDSVILLIITDGEENYSKWFSAADTKKRIEKVQKEHDWKVVFIGANIDSFSEGQKISVDSDKCVQYNQSLPGNLLFLLRSVSGNVSEYRKSRSDGDIEANLNATLMNIYRSETTYSNLSPVHGMMPPHLFPGGPLTLSYDY